MWTAAVVAAALGATAPVARAQTAMLPSPPDSAELRALRVAVADGPSQSTFWMSARLEGAADDVSLIVPAPPDAAVDLSTDAWFEALEEVTNTRVLPPAQPPDVTCDASHLPEPGEHDRIGDAAHVATVPPSAPAEMLSFSELIVWLEGKGLDLSFDAMSTYADLDIDGYRFMLLRYEVPPGTSTLATVRMVSPVAGWSIPLMVSRAGASAAKVSVWTFASGPAGPLLLPWVHVDAAELRWDLSGDPPWTNYRDVLLSALDGGGAWVVDAAGHAAIFRSTPIAGGATPIPSLAEGYFDRASGYGDAQADPTACIMRVASLESSSATVARVCPSGMLAKLGEACEESPQTGQIAPDDLRCGGIADDLALAMSGIEPGQRWLTRWTGQLPAWTARPDETFTVLEDSGQSPLVVCGDWDASVCEADAGTGGAGGTGGTGGTGGNSAPPTGVGGYGGGSSVSDPPAEDPYYDYDDDTYVYVEGSCWGDTSTTTAGSDTEDDACSGDSSSSSADNEQHCSGDSSTASDDEACAGDTSDSSSGDDACSGDTSDSSSSGDDACSGDTSDSSSSGADTCSGDSSSGSSSAGESCSGSSTDGASSDCAMSGSKRGTQRRLPTSAFTLLLVASGLAARRSRKADERRSPFR